MQLNHHNGNQDGSRVKRMLLYLYNGKTIGQRILFRQVRATQILLIMIGSYWLINRTSLLECYLLNILGILVLLIDFNRPKKSLTDDRCKLKDFIVMIGADLFLAGSIAITGAQHSPLIYTVLIPIIIYAAEFEIKVVAWNYLGFSLFLLTLSISGGTTIDLKNLINTLIIIITAGICLIIIGACRRFQNHFNQKVDRLLSRDELTGLYNRRFLKYSVSEQIKANKPFGFILIDINYFKFYNDSWGHSAGDDLLITIAKILHKSVRPQDLVIRHSGDEFIVMLTESDQTTVKNFLSKIIQSIESFNFPGEECFPDHKLTISYGHTLFPGNALHYQDLFTAADQALYQYKKEHCQG